MSLVEDVAFKLGETEYLRFYGLDDRAQITVSAFAKWYAPQELHFKHAAKAAIEATLTGLREPSEAMIARGRFALEETLSFTPEQGVAHCLSAMIDQALLELREQS